MTKEENKRNKAKKKGEQNKGKNEKKQKNKQAKEQKTKTKTKAKKQKQKQKQNITWRQRKNNKYNDKKYLLAIILSVLIDIRITPLVSSNASYYVSMYIFE